MCISKVAPCMTFGTYYIWSLWPSWHHATHCTVLPHFIKGSDLLLVSGFVLLLREEGSISLWWKEEEETEPTWVFTCDFWLLCGFRMDRENELGLQMVHSVVNWLAGSPFWNKPSHLAQLHTEHVSKYEETILQQLKALQLLHCLVRSRVVVVLRETQALMVGGVGVSGVCRLLDKPWRLKSSFRELQLLEIRLVQILLALLAPSGWLLVAHSY